MNVPLREIVIWAHSECRSTMALFREVKRLAGVPVAIALWKHGDADDVRVLRESQGQGKGEFADLNAIPVGENLSRGRALLSAHRGPGVVHVFCVYQNSPVWRQLICEAKSSGSRVVIYAEAPCPMCIGPKAVLKRLYYRIILPLKLRKVISASDAIFCASGPSGIPALRNLGWPQTKIVPFGYASALPNLALVPATRNPGANLRILHAGIEAPYRGVDTLLQSSVILKDMGIPHELFRTHGSIPAAELASLYASCDIFVACGLCEPWGIRVNDAIHAGLPVVVSTGMGASWLVGCFWCGAVFSSGKAHDLAKILARFASDTDFASRCRVGVASAHKAWTPEARAKVFIENIRQIVN